VRKLLPMHHWMERSINSIGENDIPLACVSAISQRQPSNYMTSCQRMTGEPH
jgi:hypothetical protein